MKCWSGFAAAPIANTLAFRHPSFYRRSMRRLLPQFSDVSRADARWRAAKAPGNVVGDGGDLRIGIAAAECRHRDDARRGLAFHPGYHDLRDVCRGRMCDGG